MKKEIYITEYDLNRLRTLIEDERAIKKGAKHLEELEEELKRAVLVEPQDIPADVVTMNSRIRLKDLEAGDEMTIQLVFPKDADSKQDRISVLAPVGTAIIGFKVGDVIDWEIPSGTAKFRVEEILYQPEAAGDFDL